jgi:RNA polymerase sigma-B factor
MPRGLQERFLLVERAGQELTARLCRAAQPAEIADKLHLTTEEVVEALTVRNGYDTLSLDGPDTKGDGEDREERALLDTLGHDEPRYELVVYRQALDGTMRALPERERELLRLRFTEDLTQAEIAERVGVSQMQVSRLLRRSVERLRAVAEANGEAMAD